MLSNNEVKYYASLKLKKYREIEKKFLIEGRHLVEECLSSDYIIECIVVSDKIVMNSFKKIYEDAAKKNISVFSLKDSLFNKLTETKESQGIAAVVHKKLSPQFPVIFNSRLVIALDRINDPGNLGTIIRTAYWFGADAVITGLNSSDIYNSKVLRSSQGAVFHVNILENVRLDEALPKLNEKEFEIYLLDVQGNMDFSVNFPKRKAVFVFGSESDGISSEIQSKGFKRMKIRGNSECESLNVAVSCGIVLYEYSRDS